MISHDVDIRKHIHQLHPPFLSHLSRLPSISISTVGQDDALDILLDTWDSFIVELSLKFVGESGEEGEVGFGWAD